MFKTMVSETARNATQTVAGNEPVRAASPFGGNYVAVFDRPQARVEASGGRYITSSGSPTGNCPAKPVDSYVATFAAPGHSGLNRRGSYVDAER